MERLKNTTTWFPRDVADLKRVVNATCNANPSGPKRKHATDVDAYVETLVQNHRAGRLKIR